MNEARRSTGDIVTDIPARLDRLPWSRFHTLVVVALGITWILDGLEVTLAGAVSGALKESPTLRFSNTDVGIAGAAYLAGAVFGAVFFGWLTDRLGRKKLFTITVLVYLSATAATAFSWNLWSFLLFRFLTGMGIGGEYTAINSTIQELVPARVRGWTDLVINGSFWVGAAMGGVAAIVLLDPSFVSPDLGWRLAFFVGAVLGLIIMILRQWIPESPRWLMSHGRIGEAEAVVSHIESFSPPQPAATLPTLALRPRPHTPMWEVAHTLFVTHRPRTLVALALMASQAFFYNAIFFTYALVLTRYYGVPEGRVALYIFPFALGNVLGPLLLGPLFDRVGRRRMIALTYVGAGIGLALTGWAFMAGWLDARTQALAWSAVFFLASAAASSAYLTVSEVFPLEMRALAISLFYAVGTGAGGFVAPWLFGRLIETGSRGAVTVGYAIGATLVIVAGLLALRFAVNAERRSLEDIAPPLSSHGGG